MTRNIADTIFLTFCTAMIVVGIVTLFHLRRRRRAPDDWQPFNSRKPRVRIVARGNWIRNDGNGFPFDPSSTCQIIFDDGGLADTRVLPADYWPEQMWKRESADHRYKIAFYRFTPRPSVRDMPLTELPA